MLSKQLLMQSIVLFVAHILSSVDWLLIKLISPLVYAILGQPKS